MSRPGILRLAQVTFFALALPFAGATPISGRSIPLRPSAETEEILTIARWDIDQYGKKRLHLRGKLTLDGQVRQVVWFVDKRDNTYQVFVLRDPSADADRIHRYLLSRGQESSRDSLVRHLERKFKRRASVPATRPLGMPPLPPTLDSEPVGLEGGDLVRVGGDSFGRLDDYYCNGSAEAQIEVWEPARYVLWWIDELARTRSTATWERTQSEFTGWPGDASCWSNSFTFVGTSWHTLECDEGIYDGWDAWFQYVIGTYGNYDFLFDDGYVVVDAGAKAGWDQF
jgi:hypothetical protein